MKLQFCIAALVLVGLPVAEAQLQPHGPVASHAPTAAKSVPKTMPAGGGDSLEKAVARVNGAVLTERDVLREMYTIFPYARQHDGFPKDLEPEIRKGALEMVVFEELVYQEAKRRGMVISATRLSRAEASFRKQFPSPTVYEQFLKLEANGSAKVMRDRIRRSLLIEDLLKTEVQQKATVSLAEAKAYYERNSKQFERGEKFRIQTISIIPPPNASAEVQKEARKRAEDALRQAKAAKSYREFGLLAEKHSDDDWHVNMGDRKEVDGAQLPPPLVQAALKMKPGEVSDLLQLGPNYTLFRLISHTPAGKAEFSGVSKQLRTDLQKTKYNMLRAELNKKLRKTAKVEIL